MRVKQQTDTLGCAAVARTMTSYRRIPGGLLVLVCLHMGVGCSAEMSTQERGRPGQVGVIDRTTNDDARSNAPTATGKAPTAVDNAAPGSVPAVPGGKPASSMPQQQPSDDSDDMTPTSITSITPMTIDKTGNDNTAGLPPDDVKALMGGGPVGNMKPLYPYAGTVFPRGTTAPIVMWEGNHGDAIYLHIKSKMFEYKDVLVPTLGLGLHLPLGLTDTVGGLASLVNQNASGEQIQIPQDIWEKAGKQTLGRDDPYTLEISARVGGVVSGPISVSFTIAQATVKGSIYYNSCNSDVAGTDISQIFAGSKVLRIPPGGSAELVTSATTCTGCHAISTNGARMIAETTNFASSQGYSFQFGSDGKIDTAKGIAVPNATYGALYPDGSKYLATSMQSDVGYSYFWLGLGVGLGVPYEAVLYDAQTGQTIANTGVPAGALMPMFSPDGAKLVFNDFAIDSGRGLVVMDYDVHADKASNRKIVMQEGATGEWRPGWPFFLPDNKAIVFDRTNSADFSGSGAGIANGATANAGVGQSTASLGVGAPVSDLHIVDIATGTVTILAKAMGYDTPADAAMNKTYLPYPADMHANFFPTVSPVSAGGYFWVFFDSLRNFGNLGVQRQLWGFAIDIRPDGKYTMDPSHPPFYLPGQEYGTTNHRAFAALDACRKDGEKCTTGVDCCGGVCMFQNDAEAEFFGQVGTCSLPPPPEKHRCARIDERCTTTAECCPSTNGFPNACIAGFCAVVDLL